MLSNRVKRSVSELPPSSNSNHQLYLIKVMPIEQMYAISTRKDNAWGIEGYEMPIQHVDPIRMMNDREILKIKKGLFFIFLID